MTRLEEMVEVQNLEMANTRASAASDPLPSYVQHTVLDTVHRLRPLDDARTICGIDVKASCKAQPHSQSHRRVNQDLRSDPQPHRRSWHIVMRAGSVYATRMATGLLQSGSSELSVASKIESNITHMGHTHSGCGSCASH